MRSYLMSRENILQKCSCEIRCAETWPLTLREERRLRVFENSAQEKLECGVEKASQWVTSQLPNILKVSKSRRLRWAGHVARMKVGMSGFKILTVTPAGKKTYKKIT